MEDEREGKYSATTATTAQQRSAAPRRRSEFDLRVDQAPVGKLACCWGRRAVGLQKRGGNGAGEVSRGWDGMGWWTVPHSSHGDC